MKVAHFGTFDVENFGDLLFPLILRRRMERLGVELVHYSPTGRRIEWADCVSSLPVGELDFESDRFDAVIVGGGDIIQGGDAGMQVYQGHCKHPMAAFPQLWWTSACLAAHQDIPLIWNTPGMPGVLSPAFGRLLVAAAGSASWMAVRDRQTAKRLRKAGFDGETNVLPDSACEVADLWSSEELAQANRFAFTSRGFGVPKEPVVVHLNPNIVCEGVEQVVTTLEQLCELSDAPLVLLAVTPWNGDVAFQKEVQDRLGESVIQIAPSGLCETVAIMSRASAYVGSSLHGLIAANAFGVRGLMVVPSESGVHAKVEGYLQMFGLERWCVTLFSATVRVWPGFVDAPAKQWTSVRERSREMLVEHWQEIEGALRGERPCCAEARHVVCEELGEGTIPWAVADELAVRLEEASPDEATLRRKLKEALFAFDESKEEIAELRWNYTKLDAVLGRLRWSVEKLYRSTRWRVGNLHWTLLSSLWSSKFYRPGYKYIDESLELAVGFVEEELTHIDESETVALPDDIEHYERFVKRHALDEVGRAGLRGALKTEPLFAVVIDADKGAVEAAAATVASLGDQIYEGWKLLICLSSTIDGLTDWTDLAADDERVRVVEVPPGRSRDDAVREAVDEVGADWVVVLEPGDQFAAEALCQVALEGGDGDVVYADDDHLDSERRRCTPVFKPDWSPELLLSYNYVGRHAFVRADVLQRIGGIRLASSVAQYELLLKGLSEGVKLRWRHIPAVLVHIPGRDRLFPSEDAVEAVAVLQQYLDVEKIPATCRQSAWAEDQGLAVQYLEWADDGPSVTLVIPTFNHHEVLKACVDSIVGKTTYRNYKILVVDNESSDPATLSYLDELSINPRMRVLRVGNDERGFSYARVNNLAAQEVDTELMLLLNNDTEVVTPAWLSHMVGYLSLPGVGACGARLLFPDGTVQHAGVLLGVRAGLLVAPGHAFLDLPVEDSGYLHLAKTTRTVSAVTGACLLTRTRDFLGHGGFDEDLRVTLNDIDYCMRLTHAGMRCVYVAEAELLHHESKSRSRSDDPSELHRFRRRWPSPTDPYYNRNLSREWLYHLAAAPRKSVP